MSKGVTVRDVESAAFIAAYAEVLKNNDKFIVPKVYLKQGLGVGSLQRSFGGGYRRGAQPKCHRDASSGIIRNVLLMLDELKLTEKCANGGRKITRVGQQALDLVA